jgi:hypothetical protein
VIERSTHSIGPLRRALRCIFEIWDQGTNFVGPSAASNKNLCKKLERLLRENWPTHKVGKTFSAL